MSTTQFFTYAYGKSPESAFEEAQYRARYDHGDLGSTGTIAEKDDFLLILDAPPDEDPESHALRLLKHEDVRFLHNNDPAGCIQILAPFDYTLDKNNTNGNSLFRYLFFGWAHS